jgi:hypothetical protein
MAQPGGNEKPVFDLQPGYLGVIDHSDPQPPGGQVIGVHQRLAAAAKEGVGAAKREGAADRPLEPDPMGVHPRRHMGGFLDGDAGQMFIGLARRHPHQVVEILLDRIACRQHLGGRIMGGAQIAGVARISATKSLGCGLGNQYSGAALGRRDGGAERGIATARNQDIICLSRARQFRVPLG